MSFDRRRLTSATELRALSHPTRLALMELLDEQGPLTATEASEHIGESPASCSFHLRTLARYGYVEEAEGGRGRQRPWRLVPQAQDIPGDELDAEARLAAGALMELLRERDIDKLRAWDATRRQYPEQWRGGATEMRMALHLTAAELAELTTAIKELLEPYLKVGAWAAGRPDTLPIAFGLHAIPTRLPTEPGGSPGGSAGASRRPPAEATAYPAPSAGGSRRRPAGTGSGGPAGTGSRRRPAGTGSARPPVGADPEEGP